jgi:hypothetical protein
MNGREFQRRETRNSRQGHGIRPCFAVSLKGRQLSDTPIRFFDLVSPHDSLGYRTEVGFAIVLAVIFKVSALLSK